jgi:hypothetical protein
MRTRFADVLVAAAVALGVGLALELVLHLAPRRTPVEAEMVTPLGAAPDIAALINSAPLQARAAETLTRHDRMALTAIQDELRYLKAAATRSDLVQIKALARDESTGRRLVDVIAQAVLDDPVRFRLGDVGRRYGLYSAVRDRSAECARIPPAATSRIPTSLLMQVKVQSMFLAATLLRELEFQGPAENFLKHMEALKTLGLGELAVGPGTPSYRDLEALYDHALCQSTYALASSQAAITERLVLTEYRLLAPASAQRMTSTRTETKNLMLAISAGLIAAWLVLQWRLRQQAAKRSG